MHKGRELRFTRRRHGRLARRAPALALLLAAALVLPVLARAAPDILTVWLAPTWAAQRQALEADNAALRTELAAAAGLQNQNAALRALLRSPAPRPAKLYTARAVTGALLYCAEAAPAAGAAVLDRSGRFAGRTADVRGHSFRLSPPDGEACFVGEEPALLCRTRQGWQVTGLPVPAPAAAGALVTTPEGYWLGRLAADPAPDPETGGLTAAAPLTDTAAVGTRFFVAAE